MTATITDLFSRPTSGGGALSTTVQTARSSGSGSLLCNSLVGWDSTTPQHFITYKLDGQGKIISGSETAWKGLVTGNQINSLTLTQGTDNGNAVGDVVVCLPTAQYGKDLADGILVEHKPDGTHGTIANLNATNATVTGTLSLPTASVKANNMDFTTLTLGYNQRTTNTSTTNALGSPAAVGVSVTVTIPNNVSNVKITGFARDAYNSTAASYNQVQIWDGAPGSGTQLSSIQFQPAAATGFPVFVIAKSPVTPGSSHTFALGFGCSSGTINIEAGATYPAFILVEAC